MSRRRGNRGRNKPSITLGLDIDTDTLRATITQTNEGQTTLLDTFTTESDPDWFDNNGTVTNPKALGGALKDFLKTIGHKPTIVHVSAANQPTLLRVLTPPAGVPQNELKNAVNQLILSQLPVTEENAEIRYILEGDRILAGTVDKQHAQALMTALGNAGIKPASIEPRGISALRASSAPTDNPDILLLINNDSAIITVREGQQLLHNRVSGSGAQDLQADAETASRALISDMLDMASSITNDAPDFTITIAGEETDNETLTRMLTNEFNRELHQPTFPLGDAPSEFITSIGLALKQDTTFDFKPQRTRSSSSRTSKATAKAKPRSNLGVILLVPIAAAGLFLYYNSLNSELETLNLEISQFRNQGLEYADISQRYDALLARQDRLNSTLRATERITGERVSFTNLVDRLVTRVTQPENGVAQAYLTGMQISAPTNQSPRVTNHIPGTQMHGVTISGVTRDTDTLSSIVEEFEQDSTIEALFDRATLASGNYSYTLQLLTMTHPDQESITAAALARQAQEELQRAQQERAAGTNLDPQDAPEPAVPLAPTRDTPEPEEPGAEEDAVEAPPAPEPEPAPAPAEAPIDINIDDVPVSTFNEDTQ